MIGHDPVSFVWLFVYWAAGILLLFLPVELYAAIKTPGSTDTFSEFIWWAFGVRKRIDGQPVRWARARRFILAGMCASLTAHFVFSFSFVPLAVFGAGCAAVIGYALACERGR